MTGVELFVVYYMEIAVTDGVKLCVYRLYVLRAQNRRHKHCIVSFDNINRIFLSGNCSSLLV